MYWKRWDVVEDIDKDFIVGSFEEKWYQCFRQVVLDR